MMVAEAEPTRRTSLNFTSCPIAPAIAEVTILSEGTTLYCEPSTRTTANARGSVTTAKLRSAEGHSARAERVQELTARWSEDSMLIGADALQR